ncbi:hypothetical protein MRX96_011636 [Rhipicephalus microplus]
MDPWTTKGEVGSGDKSEEKADKPQWTLKPSTASRPATTTTVSHSISGLRKLSSSASRGGSVAQWLSASPDTPGAAIVVEGQQLLTLDLVMFLLTEGHALEHCSIQIYASHFPSYSKLFMEDLETQCWDLGKAFKSFDVKRGLNLGGMNAEDWKFLWTLETEWVNE